MSPPGTSETNAPCFIEGFNYYDRLKTAIFAPIGLTALLFLVGFAWAQRRRVAPRRNARNASVPAPRQTFVQVQMSRFYEGVWWALEPVLFILDLLYPAITRTLWQFHSCRDLGDEAGSWLEAARRRSFLVSRTYHLPLTLFFRLLFF